MTPEDFGDFGDEVFLNLCAEDWLENVNERRQHDIQERTRQLQEAEVDDVFDQMNERDLCDIVREHDEEQDWLGEEEEDYYDCSWEE